MRHILVGLATLLFSIQGFSASELEQKYIAWPTYANITNKRELGKIQKLQKIYENWRKNGSIKGSERIPKIIHFVWLGGALPQANQDLITTWKKTNPSWKVYVWTDKEVETFSFFNKKAFDAAKNLTEKADILRYELLYQLGGIYVDCDVQCLQSFDTLAKSCDLFVGMESLDQKPLDNYISGAVIGAIPKHPLILKLLSTITPGPGDSDSLRINVKTGPGHITRYFLHNAATYSPNITCLPPSYFCPFYSQDMKQNSLDALKKTKVKKETMAIHYWGTCPTSKK
jgi:mannosyltransferase OCH1-like enzyme